MVRSEQNFVDVVREVTRRGRRCGCLRSNWKRHSSDSLDSLRMMGVCAAYGHVSGPPDPIDIIQDLGAEVHSSLPDLLSCTMLRNDPT